MKAPARRSAIRIPAIDVARGLSMLLVVSMHTILGIEAAAGQRSGAAWLVDFAQAFRVPAFFLISGLFLRRAMSLGWLELFQKRIFGLLVLFAVWSAIHIAIRSYGSIMADPVAGLFGKTGVLIAFLNGFIQPFGLLWFLYLMIVFLLISRALFSLPPLLVIGAAMALETARISSGMTLLDEFSGRFFYFYLGLLLAPLLFPFFRADRPDGAPPRDKVPLSNPILGIFLALWIIGHALLVGGGYDHWRGISLLASLAGIAALFAIGLLFARLWPEGWLTRLLSLIGNRSIVIFLVFTIPMAAFRIIGLTFWPDMPLALLSVLVIIGALGISLLVERLVRGTWLARLFERPVIGKTRPDAR